MRVLVTGGAGFIGSSVVRKFLEEGHLVAVFDNLETGAVSNLPVGINLIEGDVRNADALREALIDVDVVVHLAAMVSVALSVAEPERCWDINVMGTQNVLRAAHAAGCKRFVLASTAAVYGVDTTLPKQEDAMQPTASPYAYGKLLNEFEAAYFSRFGTMETVCLRFFNVYGPRQRPDSPYSGVISIAIAKLLQNETFTVFGTGEQTRDFVYVDDVAAAVFAGATRPGLRNEVINVGRGERISLLELLSTLGEVIGTEPKLAFAEPRPGDVLHSQADVTRLKTVLGVKPRVDLYEGLRETLSWMKAAVR